MHLFLNQHMDIQLIIVLVTVLQQSIMNSIHLVKEDVVDIIDIAEYALNPFEKFAFNELKTSLLKDVLRRIISINKWNLDEETKEILKIKMLSIANMVINDIKEA